MLQRLAGMIHLGMLLAIASTASALRTGGEASSAPECTFNHSRLDSVLRKFVKDPVSVSGIKSTLFDYEALLASDNDVSKLEKYVKSLASFQPSCLPPNGKLAFWANVYNAFIVHLVASDARHHGGKLAKSIRDLKGDADDVWGRKAGVVNGKAMTLEEVLTAARDLGDPRIHAAVNCGSLSCPDLSSNAYSAEDVQVQLDKQVKQWVANPTKGAKKDGDGLLVSHIFDWHAEDFPSVSSFLAGPLGLAKDVAVKGYLPYNWDLNTVR